MGPSDKYPLPSQITEFNDRHVVVSYKSIGSYCTIDDTDGCSEDSYMTRFGKTCIVHTSNFSTSITHKI